MGVPRYERKNNNAIYVNKCLEVCADTIEYISKLKGRYWIELTESMVENAREAFSEASYANSIFMSQKNYKYTLNRKQDALIEAIGRMGALTSQLDILYVLMKKGDQAFGDKKHKDQIFTKWGSKIEECNRLLNKMVEVNYERSKAWAIEEISKKEKLVKKSNVNKDS